MYIHTYMCNTNNNDNNFRPSRVSVDSGRLGRRRSYSLPIVLFFFSYL